MASSLTSVSVVVPAFNEELLIGATLNSIRAAAASFSRRKWRVELVVCDNNSTDRTREIAAEAGAVVVFEPVNQIGRARNRGAAAATGDWLIFVDADSHPSAHLFEAVAREIESGQCIAGGSTVKLDEPHFIAGLITRLWNRLSLLLKWLAGSFIFVRADAFRAIGGFNEEFFAAEELDLSRRLKHYARRVGKRIVILRAFPLVTSARKMRLYKPREHLSFLLRAALFPKRTLRNRNACKPWYDGRR